MIKYVELIKILIESKADVNIKRISEILIIIQVNLVFSEKDCKGPIIYIIVNNIFYL